MTEIKHLYHILEEMVENAIKGNKRKIEELNRIYEALVPKFYHDPLTYLELEYDNCRQSCVMSVNWLSMREQFLLDVNKRFPRLLK